MSSSLFTLLVIFSGVSYSYPNLTFGQCVDRMIKEQDAVAVLQARYPSIDLVVRCDRQD